MDLTDLAQRFRTELARTFELQHDRKAVALEDDGRGDVAPARAPDLIVARLEVTARPLIVEGVNLWLDDGIRVEAALAGLGSRRATRAEPGARVRTSGRLLSRHRAA